MSVIARQSTATIVTVGPVLDADGVAVTGGVVGDFKISKNGGAPAALNGSATLTHRNTGHYSLSLTTSDLDTVGTAEIVIDDTTNACPMKEIQVIEEAVYDAMFAASAPGYVANAPVNVAQFGGSNGTFASGRPEVNATHWGGTAVASANVLIDGAITAAKIASDAITDAKVASDVTIASVTGSVGSVTGNVGGNVTGSVGSVATGGITAASIAADAIGASELAADAASEIATAVTTALGTGSGLTTLATAAELAKVPKSDSNVSWNATALAAINAEADTALSDYDAPTYTELLNLFRIALRSDSALATDLSALLTTLNTDLGSGAGDYANTADSLEANRDNIGTAGAGLTEAGGDGDHLNNINLPNQTMDIVGNITGNLSGSVGSVTGAVGSVTEGVTLADDAITASKFDESTAFPLAAVDSGATAVARTGADADTLETLSDQIDGVAAGSSPQLLQNTTIATLATQTSFTLTAGSADNDAYNGGVAIFTDQSTSTQKAFVPISDYVGSTRTITLSAAPAFTIAVGDTIDIVAAASDAPTAAAIRTEIDNNSTQLAAIVADTNEIQADWANGGRLDLILDARASQTTADAIEADTQNIQSRIPASLNSGRMDSSVGAYQTGLTPLQPTTAGRTLDVTATGAAGIDWGNVENPSTSNSLSGTSILEAASVTTVSTTNTVGGLNSTAQANVRTAVGMSTANLDTQVGAISSVVATIRDRIGSWTGTARNTILGAFQALFRSDADATVPSDINADLGSGAGDANNVTDSLEAIANSGGSGPTAEQIADAVCDEALSGHQTAGTVGKALTDAQAAGNPWEAAEGISVYNQTLLISEAGVVNLNNPVLRGGSFNLIIGATYNSMLGNALRFEFTDSLLDWTTASSVVLRVNDPSGTRKLFESSAGTVTSLGSNQYRVTIALTAAETAKCTHGSIHPCYLDVTVSGSTTPKVEAQAVARAWGA